LFSDERTLEKRDDGEGKEKEKRRRRQGEGEQVAAYLDHRNLLVIK
jgi:hypothetical protein